MIKSTKKILPKIIIYYFSGTGNAKNVATWIKAIAELENVETKIIDISQLPKRKIQHIPENTLVGFCSPTHGFNFPPIMMHFVFRFPASNQNNVFIVNTRAGMKMGKYFVPGISGIALLLSALILVLKGYKIRGLRSIDLPSNWISLHPGLKRSVVDSIYERRKKDTFTFTQKILQGKKDVGALKDIIQDIIIAPVAVLYYLIGRFVLAKTFIASRDCTHCNLCVEKCPVGAIKVIDNRCFWTYKCESCMQCMNNCPARAIETAHGFIIGLSYLFYTIILIWIYRLTGMENHMHAIFPSEISKWVLSVMNTLLYFLFLLPGYRVMHYLLKFRLLERFIVFTSFTTYKFWRRYKPPKNARNI